MHACESSLCLVLLNIVTICEWSLLGRDCITQSIIVYDQFYIQSITGQMMNVCTYMYVCMYVFMHVCMYAYMYVYF